MYIADTSEMFVYMNTTEAVFFRIGMIISTDDKHDDAYYEDDDNNHE